MAARSYFGKSAKALTLGEGAMLAGLLKGPNFFNPDRRPERARERLGYVLGRMQEDGVISPEQRAEALAAPPKIVALDRQRRDTGFHFVDFLGREAKAGGIESLTAQPYTVHSTINATLQRDTEAALQEGLAHYEIENGRVQFHGPEANIAEAVQKLSAGNHGAGHPGVSGRGTAQAQELARRRPFLRADRRSRAGREPVGGRARAAQLLLPARQGLSPGRNCCTGLSICQGLPAQVCHAAGAKSGLPPSVK